MAGISRSRGTDHGHGTSHGRRAAIQVDVPSGFSPEEVAAGHRDKRLRPDPSALNTENLTQVSSNSALTWAPQLVRGNRLVSVGDSTSSRILHWLSRRLFYCLLI